MSQVTILVSLLFIFIGEAIGETTCRLHILEDAEEVTTGERLLHFMFFPYTSPEKVNYQLCETSQSTHWLLNWDIWKESLSKMIAIFAKSIRTTVTNWPMPIGEVTFYSFVIVMVVYFTLWIAECYPRKAPGKETSVHPGRRKLKHRNGDYKRDKLRLLKAQRTKSGISPKLMHLHKMNYSLSSLGKSELKSQTHISYRYQPVFHRRSQRYSDEKLPKYILSDLLNDGTLREKKCAESKGRERSFKDVREETLETLLKRKYDVGNNQTAQSISPEVRDGGGGDFVGGTNIHSIGRPCASSSFISSFDAEMIDPAEVDNNGEEFIIENNGNLSQGSFNVRRHLYQENELTDCSPRHREPLDNSWTLQSFSDWMPTPSYLPNTPNDSFLTSFGARTDRNMVFDDPGDESALITTMMDSFVSVSESLQKTSTWYGSDDMEMSLFQWLSAVMVTKRLAQKAWTLLIGDPDPSPLYTSPPPRTVPPIPAAESPTSFSPQFEPTHQQYYPDRSASILNDGLI
ncbi:uncharacterized protein LOC110447447 isoform X2 [Mizuhopecten yessoensis]|uniref:Uncharacterized protein n=1 Tax=Mizuhopecten yessoensis TaxID=6573 RepID=A0A210QVC6_MIZYE|nr:uncharacterized protein LOC110447447 isoform X2 [Mizuhopecten yessoensis]OWF52685.1 hypothetical protein KP79_PYT06947 [Mizuhopecten yessoensis]